MASPDSVASSSIYSQDQHGRKNENYVPPFSSPLYNGLNERKNHNYTALVSSPIGVDGSENKNKNYNTPYSTPPSMNENTKKHENTPPLEISSPLGDDSGFIVSEYLFTNANNLIRHHRLMLSQLINDHTLDATLECMKPPDYEFEFLFNTNASVFNRDRIMVRMALEQSIHLETYIEIIMDKKFKEIHARDEYKEARGYLIELVELYDRLKPDHERPLRLFPSLVDARRAYMGMHGIVPGDRISKPNFKAHAMPIFTNQAPFSRMPSFMSSDDGSERIGGARSTASSGSRYLEVPIYRRPSSIGYSIPSRNSSRSSLRSEAMTDKAKEDASQARSTRTFSAYSSNSSNSGREDHTIRVIRKNEGNKQASSSSAMPSINAQGHPYMSHQPKHAYLSEDDLSDAPLYSKHADDSKRTATRTLQKPTLTESSKDTPRTPQQSRQPYITEETRDDSSSMHPHSRWAEPVPQQKPSGFPTNNVEVVRAMRASRRTSMLATADHEAFSPTPQTHTHPIPALRLQPASPSPQLTPTSAYIATSDKPIEHGKLFPGARMMTKRERKQSEKAKGLQLEVEAEKRRFLADFSNASSVESNSGSDSESSTGIASIPLANIKQPSINTLSTPANVISPSGNVSSLPSLCVPRPATYAASCGLPSIAEDEDQSVGEPDYTAETISNGQQEGPARRRYVPREAIVRNTSMNDYSEFLNSQRTPPTGTTHMPLPPTGRTKAKRFGLPMQWLKK